MSWRAFGEYFSIYWLLVASLIYVAIYIVFTIKAKQMKVKD